MKIAISHTRYSFVGGVEKYIYSLVERLLDGGHEVHYFCHFWEPEADPRIRFHKVPNLFKLVRFLKVWSFDRWSEQAIRRDDFDVVHGFTKTGWQDIYTDGSGTLKDYQEYSLREGGASPLSIRLKELSPHQKIIERIEKRRFARGNFRRVVAMSRLAQQQICKRYNLEESEVEVIYNGIDLSYFNPKRREQHREVMRKRLNYGPNDVVLLIIGNDYRRKGVETLIEAVKLITDEGGLSDGRQLQIAVVGKERHAREAKLLEQARQLKLHNVTKFFGPQRDIAEWHAMSDVHILPSRFDIFGNVVLEAMAMGIPTIVSAQAGAAEVVKHGETGYVLDDSRDAEALAKLIRDTVGSGPERLKTLGDAARMEAENYSWDRHFERIFELYKAVAEDKQKEKASQA